MNERERKKKGSYRAVSRQLNKVSRGNEPSFRAAMLRSRFVDPRIRRNRADAMRRRRHERTVRETACESPISNFVDEFLNQPAGNFARAPNCRRIDHFSGWPIDITI